MPYAKEPPLFRIWVNMKTRCYNPNTPNYKHYGARGIKVCDRWQIYKNFEKDMGERPEGYQLDRINNDGDYTPENCKWSSRKEQLANRRQYCTNRSGVTGVVPYLNGRWRAYKTIGRKYIHIGHFDTMEDAIVARKAYR